MWECLKAVIYSFNLFIANIFHRWRITKMESWRSLKVPSSTRCSSWQQCSKSKFNWKSDFGTEVDLAIQPSQEEREKEILNAKHSKLSIYGVQIPHPMTSKKTGLLEVITYQVLFWQMLMNIQNWIQQRKLQRKGETYYFMVM